MAAGPHRYAPPVFGVAEAKRLATRLDRYLGKRPGEVTAAIKDLRTGLTYSYSRGRRTATASIVKVDILVALLLRNGRRGLSRYEKSLAEAMIRYSDNAAATALYIRIGGSAGLARANRRLKLRNTVPGPPGYWGSTTTSAEDQIRLLGALTGKSPVPKAGRRYVLGLMARVVPDQAWGVRAAAREGDLVAVKNGWLPRQSDGHRWTVNTIGRVEGHGHDYLIAVLSRRNPSMGAGVATVERVASLMAESLPAAGEDG
jgi:beta-lactamase class A